MLEEFGKRDAVNMLLQTQADIVKFLEQHPRSNKKQQLLRFYVTCTFSIEALNREIEGMFSIEQMKRIDDLIEQEKDKYGQ